jgi:hypothetical protein
VCGDGAQVRVHASDRRRAGERSVHASVQHIIHNNTLFPVLTHPPPHPALTPHPSDSTGLLTPQGSKGRKEGIIIHTFIYTYAAHILRLDVSAQPPNFST